MKTLFMFFIAFLSRLMGQNAAAEWVTGNLLTRGKIEGTPIANAGVVTIDIDCAGDSELTVQVDMTGTAVGDLAVNVAAMEADDFTQGMSMPVIRAAGPTVSGGVRVLYLATFDVSGVSKVRMVIANNNAAPQVINRASWRLS